MFDSIKLIEGNISSRLGELTNSVLEDLTVPTRKYKLKDLVLALEQDPITYACTQLKTARAVNSFGIYGHENKEIDTWIKYQFEEMNIAFSEVVGRLSSALPLGFSICENIFKKTKTKTGFSWGLDTFHFLNPEKVVFQVTKGDLSSIKFTESNGEVKIPYWKCTHVTNGLSTNFGRKYAYGSPELIRAFPYIKLKQLIFAEMGISAKTLATGILVGRADSNNVVQLKDEFGRPISDGKGNYLTVTAVENLAKQFKTIENHSRIITDKSNEITALQIPNGAGFWSMALQLCDEQIMRSLLTPETIWREGNGALGMGALSQTQLSIFDSSIDAINKQIKENLIEKVVKPLIKWNFGDQSNYGKFEHTVVNDPQNEAFIIQNLFTAIGSGILDGQDLEVQNLIRKKLGLNLISPDEQAQKDKIKQDMEKEMQKLQNIQQQEEQAKIPEQQQQ